MNRKAYGFTIVELLIVIVVIAILAAISFVAYNNIRDRANSSVTEMDLANLETKLKTYQIENNRFPESIEEMQASGFGATEKMNWGWDWNDDSDGVTKKGEYLVAGYNDASLTESAYSIYFWDYYEGGWQRMRLRYRQGSGWRSYIDPPYLANPESWNTPCTVAVLQDCRALPQPE